MIRPSVSAALLGILLGGCTIPLKFRSTAGCRAEQAIGYVGQRYTPRIGGIVKQKTQASSVRTIARDAAVTQDFRASRANIVLDEKNLVTRIYCG